MKQKEKTVEQQIKESDLLNEVNKATEGTPQEFRDAAFDLTKELLGMDGAERSISVLSMGLMLLGADEENLKMVCKIACHLAKKDEYAVIALIDALIDIVLTYLRKQTYEREH